MQGCYDDLTSAIIVNMVSSTSVQAFAFTFHLQDLPSYTEISALFDQYRIRKVKLMFYPQQTDNVTTAAGQTTAIIHTVIDRNDSGSPTNETTILQYDGLKTHKFDRQFSVTCSPRVNVPVYAGSVFTGYGEGKGGQWINSADADVPYYCIKALIPACTSTSLSGWRLYTKFYFEARNVI